MQVLDAHLEHRPDAGEAVGEGGDRLDNRGELDGGGRRAGRIRSLAPLSSMINDVIMREIRASTTPVREDGKSPNRPPGQPQK
jgi:hypothetical protein